MKKLLPSLSPLTGVNEKMFFETYRKYRIPMVTAYGDNQSNCCSVSGKPPALASRAETSAVSLGRVFRGVVLLIDKVLVVWVAASPAANQAPPVPMGCKLNRHRRIVQGLEDTATYGLKMPGCRQACGAVPLMKGRSQKG